MYTLYVISIFLLVVICEVPRNKTIIRLEDRIEVPESIGSSLVPKKNWDGIIKCKEFHYTDKNTRSEINIQVGTEQHAIQASRFNTYYEDESSDRSLTREIKNTIEKACEIIQFHIGKHMHVDISVRVRWRELGSRVLGSARPSYFYLLDGMYYCDAYINQVARLDVDPNTYDIIMSLNSEYDNWHVDYSTLPSLGEYDLLTVVVHELFHGIGMVGMISSDGSYASGSNGKNYIYDHFLNDLNTRPIVDSLSKSDKNVLLYRVTNPKFVTIGNQLIIYTPSGFAAGSSVYHLDNDSNSDSFFGPFLQDGERNTMISEKELFLLRMIGWVTNDCSDYGVDCNVCTLAGCAWCSGKCLSKESPELAHEMCSLLIDECPVCSKDEDCPSPIDKCHRSSCVKEDASGFRCYQEPIVCEPGPACTWTTCDPEWGCLVQDIPCEPSGIALSCENEGYVPFNLEFSNVTPFAPIITGYSDSMKMPYRYTNVNIQFSVMEQYTKTHGLNIHMQCGGIDNKISLLKDFFPIHHGLYDITWSDEYETRMKSSTLPGSYLVHPNEHSFSKIFFQEIPLGDCFFDVSVNENSITLDYAGINIHYPIQVYGKVFNLDFLRKYTGIYCQTSYDMLILDVDAFKHLRLSGKKWVSETRILNCKRDVPISQNAIMENDLSYSSSCGVVLYRSLSWDKKIETRQLNIIAHFSLSSYVENAGSGSVVINGTWESNKPISHSDNLNLHCYISWHAKIFPRDNHQLFIKLLECH